MLINEKTTNEREITSFPWIEKIIIREAIILTTFPVIEETELLKNSGERKKFTVSLS